MEHEESVSQSGQGDGITFSKAAKIGEISVWEVARIVNEENMMWVSDDHFKSDLQDL
jgi:hypothetical protein